MGWFVSLSGSEPERATSKTQHTQHIRVTWLGDYESMSDFASQLHRRSERYHWTTSSPCPRSRPGWVGYLVVPSEMLIHSFDEACDRGLSFDGSMSKTAHSQALKTKLNAIVYIYRYG